MRHYRIAENKPLAVGKAVLKFDFTYDGGGIGTGRILVNEEKVAEGLIEESQCCLIALGETADVGRSTGKSVSGAYRKPFAFSGTLQSVVIDLTPSPDGARK